MCKSMAEGGQRCAAHTRPRFEAAPFGTAEWDDAAAEHASTKSGREELVDAAAQAQVAGDMELMVAAETAVARGDQMRAVAEDAALAAVLPSMAPVDIDTKLADLYGQRYVVQQRATAAYDHLAREIARHEFGRGFRGSASEDEVDEVVAAAEALAEDERTWPQRDHLKNHDRYVGFQAEVDRLTNLMVPYTTEFARRGGWSRAFLVVNDGTGHVHSSMSCSTCRPTTQFHWVTELSDHDEAEIVEKAGERACSSCFPSAPVEVRNRPTQLFSPDEVAAHQAREQRAAAAVQRQTDRIAKGLTSDGSEFEVNFEEVRGGTDRDPVTGETTWSQRVRPKRERFKTERAATTWLVQSLVWNQDRPDDLEARAGAHGAIVEAIAAKHGKSVDEVWADIRAKVVAKRRRDGYTD